MKLKSWAVLLLAIILTDCLKAQGQDSYGLTDNTHSAVTPVDRSEHQWWPDRHKRILSRIAEGNVDMIFVGDSITEGWRTHGKDIWKQYYAPRNAVNMGFGGDRTQHVLWRLDHGEIDGIHPKLAVVMIGTNNCNENTPEEVADGIKAVCARIHTKLPETKILLLAVFPRAAGEQRKDKHCDGTFNEEWAKMNKASELASQIADNKMIYYLNINKAFLNEEGDIRRAMMHDLLHPNANGYKAWAEAMEPTIKKLMGEQEDDPYGLAGKTHSAVTPVDRNNEPWWAARHKRILSRVAQGNVDMIFVGDSITSGWESKGKDVWKQYYGSRNAVNLGYGADRTQHVLWRLDHGEIDGINPKLALVMIGTNNCGKNSVEEIADGIKAVCSRIRTKLPKTKILLLAVFPRASGEQRKDKTCDGTLNPDWTKVNQASELASAIADNKMIYYQNINDVFLNNKGDIMREVMDDLLHPNANGYKLWAEAMEPTIKKLMNEQ